MTASFTARKLNAAPFVEFYRRDPGQEPKRVPLNPRLLSAPTNIKFSDKGERVAITANGNFAGNSMVGVTETGKLVWSDDERFMLMCGGTTAANKARLYERMGDVAMVPVTNDELLPPNPANIAIAGFAGPRSEWLFCRRSSDPSTSMRIYRYGYGGFTLVNTITLPFSFSKIEVAGNFFFVSDGGTNYRVYEIDTSVTPNVLSIKTTLTTGLTGVVPMGFHFEGKILFYKHNVTIGQIDGNFINERVAAWRYNANTKQFDIAGPAGISPSFNDTMKQAVGMKFSANKRYAVIYSSARPSNQGGGWRHYQNTVTIIRLEVGSGVTPLHESRGNAANRRTAASPPDWAISAKMVSGVTVALTHDGQSIVYAYADAHQGASGTSGNEETNAYVNLYRSTPTTFGTVEQLYWYSAINYSSINVHAYVNDIWSYLISPGASAGWGQIFNLTLNAAPVGDPMQDWYRDGTLRKANGSAPFVVQRTNYPPGMDNQLGSWPWAMDLRLTQAQKITISPSGRYAIFQRTGVAPIGFQFRRNDAGVWNYAEEYKGSVVSVYKTDDPKVMTLVGNYALPVNTVLSDLVWDHSERALAVMATHATDATARGRFVLAVGTASVTLSGKDNQGSRSRFAFSPGNPLGFFAATYDMSPATSRVDLYKFNTPEALAFTHKDNEASAFGPIAFSKCDDVIVVHGGSTGLPFSFFKRKNDTLEPVAVEGFENFPADVKDIKFLPDCSGLVIVTPGAPGEPDKLIVIETEEKIDPITGLPIMVGGDGEDIVIELPDLTEGEVPDPSDPTKPLPGEVIGIDVGYVPDPADPTGETPLLDADGNPIVSIIVVRQDQDIVSPNTRPESEGVPPVPEPQPEAGAPPSPLQPYDPWGGIDPNTGLPTPPKVGQPEEGKKGLTYLDLTGKPVRDSDPENPQPPRQLVDRTQPITMSVNVGWEH